MRYLPFRSALFGLFLLSATVQSSAQGDLAARGRYLVALGDCQICHTAPKPGAKPFAGGYPLHAVFGTVYSTNITPDAETGIGRWTASDFYRALHAGIAADGHHLYPAFPYPYFEKISRADSDAMYAYLRTVPPVHQPPHPDALLFPTNIRWLMTFWDWLFTPQSPFKPLRWKPAAWNRGGEIMHGLGHCGGCHTPKNFFFADKSDRAFQGTTIDGWRAPNLTGSMRTGLGSWSVADIEQFLKTGKNRHGRTVGSMRDVVRFSTSQWTDADRHAVAVYLKSLPAAPETEPAAPSANIMQSGQATYVARCAVCHDEHGSDYPSLANNTLLNAPDATTVLRVVLAGSQPPPVAGQSSGFSMPAFPVLSDVQLADVATYIRNSWGNHGGVVTASAAGRVRATLTSNQ